MRRSIGRSTWYAIITFIALVAETSCFVMSPTRKSVGSFYQTHNWMDSSFGDNEGQSPALKKQEKIMEMSSIAGADAIRKLDLQERTKRAMLAEAVEDRIFELVDDLEDLVRKSGGLENLTDETKEEAVEMAKQTKALQIQYDDLVNGRPSPLLDLEGTTGDSE